MPSHPGLGSSKQSLGFSGAEGTGHVSGPQFSCSKWGLCYVWNSLFIKRPYGRRDGRRPSASLDEPLEQDTSPTFIQLSWIR